MRLYAFFASNLLIRACRQTPWISIPTGVASWVLALALFAPVALAQSTTIITSLPYEIQTPGTYVLAEDLTVGSSTQAISVRASNVTLDCMGHSITHSVRVKSSRGIVVDPGLSDVTVQNCSLYNFDGGITIGVRTHRMQLIRNRILGGGAWGILVRGHGSLVSENHVIGLRSISSRSEGIILALFDEAIPSDDVIFSHNVIADIYGVYEALGISVYGGVRPVLTDNSILDIRQGGGIALYLSLAPAVDAVIRNNVMMHRAASDDERPVYAWDGRANYAIECTGNTIIGFEQISYTICSDQRGNVVMQ